MFRIGKDPLFLFGKERHAAALATEQHNLFTLFAWHSWSPQLALTTINFYTISSFAFYKSSNNKCFINNFLQHHAFAEKGFINQKALEEILQKGLHLVTGIRNNMKK